MEKLNTIILIILLGIVIIYIYNNYESGTKKYIHGYTVEHRRITPARRHFSNLRGKRRSRLQ